MLSLQDKYIYHKSTQNITNSLQIIVSPLISHNLWKVYAVPKILYGLEVMPIKKKEMEQMEIMQRKLLRQLQCLSNQVVYVLIGAVPIYMMIERNMLSLLMNIIRNNTTVEYKILMRQLAMRKEKDHTFINRIQLVQLKSLWNNQNRKRIRRETREKARRSFAFPPFLSLIHIYYLYASTVHMYCIYPAILNRK